MASFGGLSCAVRRSENRAGSSALRGATICEELPQAIPGSDDDARRFPASRAAQLAYEALHRLIAPGKAVVRDQSCQIALLLRPRARPCSMSSRCASQVLRTAGFAKKGAIKSGVTSLAGFASRSEVSSLAGFAGVRFPQKPSSRTTTVAAFR
jgi:hypothetical protein